MDRFVMCTKRMEKNVEARSGYGGGPVGQAYVWMDGRSDGQSGGQTVRQTDGRTDGWSDRRAGGRTEDWTCIGSHGLYIAFPTILG